MRRFRQLFIVLFIFSLFAGAIHQANHDHHNGEICEVCVLSHSPALLNDCEIVVFIEPFHTPFVVSNDRLPAQHIIPSRSRSPPIS